MGIRAVPAVALNVIVHDDSQYGSIAWKTSWFSNLEYCQVFWEFIHVTPTEML
jgi:hypothetical protein